MSGAVHALAENRDGSVCAQPAAQGEELTDEISHVTCGSCLLDLGAPQCDALIEYVIHGWTGQPGGKRRRPRDLQTYLRCKRPADHHGEHRSDGDVRQWKDHWTSGWIELPEEDEATA